MKEEIFTTVTLPSGRSATVYEGFGRHMIKAMSKSKGDTGLMIQSLITQLVKIDEKHLTDTEVDEMHMRDVSYLSEVISTMLSNDIMGL